MSCPFLIDIRRENAKREVKRRINVGGDCRRAVIAIALEECHARTVRARTYSLSSIAYLL